MPDQPAAIMFAWCFSHGTLHKFVADEAPWCGGAWVAFAAPTGKEAFAAKRHAYGDARFLDQLSTAQQLEVIEAAEARQ
ncbi:hypothetical protein [Streptomyces sp. NBC_01789]|uniref:hypothetical protein n=1 Tax=Streptomyces sp. NBC_01789 TaxID=2975941 RepID=UPI00225BF94A|nr:hypothetical protein [Streptomyces sp. NBC_01789]MCX4450688.1 hypothetical protein [Streptomyces sp. NBC_01789]